MTHSDERIPVIANADELNIPWQTLQTIIAGRSLIDNFEMQIETLDDAGRFLKAYGFEDHDEPEALRARSLEYIDSVLLRDCSLSLPPAMRRLRLPQLLLAASSSEDKTRADWSCMILKVCHAVAHARWTRDENAYRAALDKVNTRLEPYLHEAGVGIWLGDDGCRIPLVEYRIKSGKHFFRLVTKLLLKEGNLSADIYDHIGMRFVTHDIFSAILLIRFLRSRHVFMYANLLPQAAKNSLAEFHQIEALFADFSGPIREGVTQTRDGPWPGSNNHYSSKNFKMIKIVERILVSTHNGRKVFFPCEIQILTRQTHEALNRKKMNHSAYEKRQVKGVRRRLLQGTSLLAGMAPK